MQLLMRLVASVCLSVCLCCLCSNFDLEISFLLCRYIFRISRSSAYIKVSGSMSRSQEKNGVTSVTTYNGVWSSFV